MTKNDNENSLRPLWLLCRRLFELKVESAKLLTTEKLTIFLGAFALAMIAMFALVLILVFLSLALTEFLSQFMPKYGAMLIVSGALSVIFVLICLLRRVLILNPLARFLSRLFFN